MKWFAVIAVIAIGSCLAACGSGSDASQSQAKPVNPLDNPKKPPKVQVPPGPPPKKLIVKDIRVGTGATVKPHTRIGTRFVAVSYRTGKPYEVRWKQPFEIEFAPGLEIKGWERGLLGMRAGGRRELVIPSKLAYHEGAVVYVIDLLSVK